MSTSNAQRFLAKGGVDDELALEMFYGTVIEAFRAKTLFWNALNGDAGVGGEALPSSIISGQVVTAGKSWQFPILGQDPDTEYHTPGTEMLGMQVEIDEGNITIDDTLATYYDVPFDQIQLSHFPVVEPFARKLGRSIATKFDKNLIRVGLNAATEPSLSKNGHTIHDGGQIVTRTAGSVETAYPDNSTGATNFRDNVAHLSELFDLDNVPEEGRFLTITPYIRRILRHDTDIFNADYNRERSNDLNRRVIGHIEGFDVMPTTNHMPSTAETNKYAKYSGDWAVDGSDDGQPVALALCGADEGDAPIGYVAAAMEEVGPIYAVMQTDERRNTRFLKAQMMVGADKLNVWSAGSVTVKDGG